MAAACQAQQAARMNWLLAFIPVTLVLEHAGVAAP